MNEQEKFLQELKELTDKYELKNVIFGANKEDRMWGFYGVEPVDSVGEFSEIVMIAARLYQSGREKLMRLYDKIIYLP